MIASSYIFLFLACMAILFQIALALGTPWGEYTLNGTYPGKLPPKVRLLALLQAAVLFLFLFFVLAKSRIAFAEYHEIGRLGVWFVAAFFVLGTLANFFSKSEKEKKLMFPVNALMLICAVVVAFS